MLAYQIKTNSGDIRLEVFELTVEEFYSRRRSLRQADGAHKIYIAVHFFRFMKKKENILR
jgi:hypothetical protein